MKEFIFRKRRYENCFSILLAIIIASLGLYIAFNASSFTGVRILRFMPIGVIMASFSLIWAIIVILSLYIPKFYKIRKIFDIVGWMLFTLCLIEFIVLGFANSMVAASKLPTKPTQDDKLGLRLSYILLHDYKLILHGVWTTIWLSLAGTVIGLVLALIFITIKTLEVSPFESEFTAFIKTFRQKVVDIYVTIVRGTPMLVQGMIIFYFLPGILAGIFKVDPDYLMEILDPSICGLITVSLNTTAYLTEVLRGGIESINKGQLEAARSLGMGRASAYVNVILPQGIKNSFPAICNEFIVNIKDTSVLSVIGVMDLFWVINLIKGRDYNSDSIFIAAIIYLILTYSISKLLGLIEKKMNLVAKPLPSQN